jgi:hypothetical protein
MICYYYDVGWVQVQKELSHLTYGSVNEQVLLANERRWLFHCCRNLTVPLLSPGDLLQTKAMALLSHQPPYTVTVFPAPARPARDKDIERHQAPPHTCWDGKRKKGE